MLKDYTKDVKSEEGRGVKKINHKKYNHKKIKIYDGNRTVRCPILSVIIRVISKIGRPRNGSPICQSRV